MLYQIPSFLLDVIVGLLGGACLLRLYMQYHRVPFGNPLGRFVFAITDWIVLPLRRIQASASSSVRASAPGASSSETQGAMAAVAASRRPSFTPSTMQRRSVSAAR